jgi:NitT/TauT family transport system substrate-binding protein
MPHPSSSRRQFLRRAGAGLLAVPFVHPARAQAKLRDVTLRLDWVFQGPNAGFMVAQDKGFYAEAGLNVDIGPGKGSGSTAQLVASKATQFGYSDGFVVGNSVSKGMSIRTVAGIYRRNPTAVIVLADSDIKTPKDLEGKSIALTPGSAQFQQWPAFAKGCGVDASKVRVVSIDPAGAHRGPGPGHRRLRPGTGPHRGDPRQQEDPRLLVRRLRGRRGQQRHRGPQ